MAPSATASPAFAPVFATVTPVSMAAPTADETAQPESCPNSKRARSERIFAPILRHQCASGVNRALHDEQFIGDLLSGKEN